MGQVQSGGKQGQAARDCMPNATVCQSVESELAEPGPEDLRCPMSAFFLSVLESPLSTGLHEQAAHNL